jgi:LPS export ABC transporter protein LptC
MNKFRDRIGGIISIVIFLSLALITAVFSKYLLNAPHKNYEIDGPTATLSKVLISKTGENGHLQSQLSAETITYDTNNEAIILSPKLLLFEHNSNPLIASSEVASLNADGDIIMLKSNVKIVRKGYDKVSGFEITAQDATFNLNSKTAFSNGPVKIKNHNYLMHGIGMEISQTERSINILKNVRLIRN